MAFKFKRGWNRATHKRDTFFSRRRRRGVPANVKGWMVVGLWGRRRASRSIPRSSPPPHLSDRRSRLRTPPTCFIASKSCPCLKIRANPCPCLPFCPSYPPSHCPSLSLGPPPPRLESLQKPSPLKFSVPIHSCVSLFPPFPCSPFPPEFRLC